MNLSKHLTRAKSLSMDPCEEWVIERRSLGVPMEVNGKQFAPDALVCVSTKSELIIGAALIPPDAPDSKVLSWMLGCMESPIVGKAQRPGAAVLIGGKLKHLEPAFRQLGIEVSIRSVPHPVVDQAVSALERDLTNPGLPPYLEQAIATETVAGFFSASAEFYDLQPWKLFEFEIPFKIEIQAKKRKDYWGVVMGGGGQEYGLMLYRSLDALSAMFDSGTAEEADRIMMATWSLSVTYDDFDDVSSILQAEYLLNGGVIEDGSAYPSAMVIDPDSKDPFRSPTQKELVELTAIIHALVDFFRSHGKLLLVLGTVTEKVIEVEVTGKRIAVLITFPAPEFAD